MCGGKQTFSTNLVGIVEMRRNHLHSLGSRVEIRGKMTRSNAGNHFEAERLNHLSLLRIV